MAPSRVVDNWVLSKFIGEGGFGKVWLGYHAKFYCTRVVKEIRSAGKGDDVKNEVEALRTLRGPNIVQMVDAFENNDSTFIVMEYCRGGDLWQYLNARGALEEDLCRYFLCQLAEGLKVLRKNNIVHRDLKPSNLLLSDDGPMPTLKIADFGIATLMQPGGLAPSFCGTVPYSAPEMSQGPYGPESDLWSVGVIMFELLTGVSPFHGDNYYELMESVRRDKVKLPDSVARKLTPGCRHLLYSLLRRDPFQRLSFEEFFNHPFFDGHDASAAMMCNDEDFLEDAEAFDILHSQEDEAARDDRRTGQGFQTIPLDDRDSSNRTDDAQWDEDEEGAAKGVALPGPSAFVLPPPLRYLVMLRHEMLQHNGKSEAAVEDEERVEEQQAAAALAEQVAAAVRLVEATGEPSNVKEISWPELKDAPATEEDKQKSGYGKEVAGPAASPKVTALPFASAFPMPPPLQYLEMLRQEMLQQNAGAAAPAAGEAAAYDGIILEQLGATRVHAGAGAEEYVRDYTTQPPSVASQVRQPYHGVQETSEAADSSLLTSRLVMLLQSGARETEIMAMKFQTWSLPLGMLDVNIHGALATSFVDTSGAPLQTTVPISDVDFASQTFPVVPCGLPAIMPVAHHRDCITGAIQQCSDISRQYGKAGDAVPVSHQQQAFSQRPAPCGGVDGTLDTACAAQKLQDRLRLAACYKGARRRQLAPLHPTAIAPPSLHMEVDGPVNTVETAEGEPSQMVVYVNHDTSRRYHVDDY